MPHPPRPPRARRRSALSVLLAAVVGAPLAGVACGSDTRYGREGGAVSVGQLTPQPNLPPLDQRPNAPPLAPGDVAVLPVEVAGGEFASERYVVQTGAVQLRVTARGGPYTMRIDGLMQARVLAADETTPLGFTAPPGEYTMRLNAGVEDTAVLTVRPVGGR